MKMRNSWTTLFDQHTLLHKQSKNPIMTKLSPSKQYVCNSTRVYHVNQTKIIEKKIKRL